MSDLENNVFTDKNNIEYPSLEDVADIRVINNNIRILNETKAELNNLGDVAREIKPNNIEDIVSKNSADINELKESLSNAMEKIGKIALNTEKILNTPVSSGVDFNAFITDMAFRGKLFFFFSLHSSNINMTITFPNYTRVVAHQITIYVENDAPAKTSGYQSHFTKVKHLGEFLFLGKHYPYKTPKLPGYVSVAPPEESMLDPNFLYTEHPIEILNSTTRKDFQNSHYTAFILDNPEDLDKITVQVEDAKTNEILNNVVQLNQMTSISFPYYEDESNLPNSAYYSTTYDFEYKKIKTF